MDPPQRDMSLSGAPPSRGPRVSCQQCHCARQENEERRSTVGTRVLRMSSVWCSDRILRSLREVRDSGVIFHWRFKNNKYNQDETPELRSTTPTPSSPWVTVGARGLTEAFAIPKGSSSWGARSESFIRSASGKPSLQRLLKKPRANSQTDELHPLGCRLDAGEGLGAGLAAQAKAASGRSAAAGMVFPAKAERLVLPHLCRNKTACREGAALYVLRKRFGPYNNITG